MLREYHTNPLINAGQTPINDVHHNITVIAIILGAIHGVTFLRLPKKGTTKAHKENMQAWYEWARVSRSNYRWLAKYGAELCNVWAMAQANQMTNRHPEEVNIKGSLADAPASITNARPTQIPCV